MKRCRSDQSLCEMSSQSSQEINEDMTEDKSSFDRFGDDLTELIVSYLPIEEKFRFECLSKRIQSLVFNKQYVLGNKCLAKCCTDATVRPSKDSPALRVELDIFEKCLRKLHSLNEIVFSDRILIDERVLRIIADNCQHLNRLTVSWNHYSSDESIEYFGRKCCQSIRSLQISSRFVRLDHQKMRRLLSFCPQLVSLVISSINTHLVLLKPDSEIVLPKLREIEINDYTIDAMIGIQNTYSDQLTSIKAGTITKIYYSDQDLVPLVAGFARFRRLHNLLLRLSFESRTPKEIYKVCQQFKQIAINCPQLKRLRVELYYVSGSQNNLSHFSSFVHLTELDIILWDNSDDISVSFADLKQLSRLKKLKISFIKLSDNDFENISQYLPKLESLSIKTAEQLTDTSVKHISQLKQLKSIDINSGHKKVVKVSDSGVKQLLNNCPDIRRITLNQLNGWSPSPDITDESIKHFIERAKQKPKIQFYFAFRPLSENFSSSYHAEVPDNLTISLAR